MLVSGYGDDDCGGVVFDFRFSLKIVHFRNRRVES